MLTLRDEFSNVEEVLDKIGNGILVVHRSNSGTSFMLKNHISSIIEESHAQSRVLALNFYSMNEGHSLFDDFIKIYQIQNKTAVFIIKDRNIESIMQSPIGRSELMKHLKGSLKS